LIAYNLGRRDEVPNQELARKLAEEKNAAGIKEIAGHLYDKNKSVASDCIKVLYEAGYINVGLIAPYAEDFARLLSSKNNRMVWGAMIALAGVASVAPEKVYPHKKLILELIETGTVITNVWGVKAYINMAKADKYYSELKPLIFKLQAECRPVDFAKRAEDMMGAVRRKDIAEYIDILESGRQQLSSAGAKRTDRVIKKLKALSEK
jgi:hypothetical protein